MLGFGGALSLRNRIINGDMRIDQRNAGASVTPSTTGAFVYTLDRWSINATQASKLSVQRNAGGVTPPDGYSHYIGLTSTSAYTSLSTDQFILSQQVEGYNITDLAWGGANAQAVTLSFWVRSSLIGQFSVTLENVAGTRSYVATYTINLANTWEQKVITIPGATSGAWNVDNTIGMYVIWNLGDGTNFQTTPNTWYSGGANGATGDVKLVGTSGATFYMTGVQLEVGSAATPFERRSYGLEALLCYRYYWRYVPENANEIIEIGQNETTTRSKPIIKTPVPMRVAPTVSTSGAATFNLRGTTTNVTCSSFSSSVSQGPSRIAIEANTATAHGGLAGGAAFFCANTTASWFDASAEL